MRKVISTVYATVNLCCNFALLRLLSISYVGRVFMLSPIDKLHFICRCYIVSYQLLCTPSPRLIQGFVAYGQIFVYWNTNKLYIKVSTVGVVLRMYTRSHSNATKLLNSLNTAVLLYINNVVI